MDTEVSFERSVYCFSLVSLILFCRGFSFDLYHISTGGCSHSFRSKSSIVQLVFTRAPGCLGLGANMPEVSSSNRAAALLLLLFFKLIVKSIATNIRKWVALHFKLTLLSRRSRTGF